MMIRLPGETAGMRSLLMALEAHLIFETTCTQVELPV